MTLPELFACIWQRDIRLGTREGKLTIDAPVGALTDDIKTALAVHRSRLLALMAGVDVETEPPASMLWPPRPAELAHWTIEWRERWGRTANELEDRGTPWPECERVAFSLVKSEMEAGPAEPSTAPEEVAVQGTMFN
jgi:hypothetical protein